MIMCTNCGEIEKDSVRVYNDELRKQNIRISPIAPVCKICAAEVSITHTCSAGKIIVINGTCGSGKTSVAEALQDMGHLAIDGDCAIQSLRNRKGTKQYEWNELIDEIAREIDILSLFGENIVLSHIVLPEDLDRYIGIFEARNMKYVLVLLKPEYHSAVERCQTRTCHNDITPEKWIRHFYDVLAFDDERVHIIDNTEQTTGETTDAILRLPAVM